MRYHPSSKSNLFKVMAAGFMKKPASVLTLGITARQWTACLLICALLSLSVAVPTLGYGVSMPRAVNSDSSNFEPVNEDLSIFTSTLRNLNAELEATLTPWRSANWVANSSTDDSSGRDASLKERAKSDDDSTIRNPNSTLNEPSAEPRKNERESSDHLPDSPAESESAAFLPMSAANPSRPLMLNQLPDSEHASIYSYENNLGSPPGQVEVDSSNQAAALRIRHRVGIANFSFGLPMASLSGRGIDAGIGMAYNSRTWNKSCTQYDAQGNCTNDHYTYDVEQSWIAPGFSSGFGYLESAAVVQFIHPEQSSNFTYHTEITPQGITDPDGTRHQFSCKSWTPISGTYTLKCNTYISNDGTFITTLAQDWVSNVNNSQTPNLSTYASASFMVVYPNGSKVYYAGAFGTGNIRKHYPVILQDSNGNRVRIAYTADQSGRIDYINDTLNRRIKFYYENDASGNPDKLVAVTIPGMNANEEIQTVRFYYETLTLNATGKFVGEVTAPATIRVLKYVYMPATKTGYKYDHDTGYGMIKKITRFVGMTASTTSPSSTGSITSDGLFAASTEYNYPDGSVPLTDVPKYTKRTDDWHGRTSETPQETFYDAPDPLPGADYVSTITVKDNGFDVETKTTSGPDGMLKETTVTRRYGPQPNQPYSQPMSKTKFTWSTASNARNLTRLEVTNDAWLTKATEFEYDQYNNQTKARECAYAAPSTACTDANALRRSETTYETGTGWIARNILSLPKISTTVVGGSTVSKTIIEYDHAVNGTASDATVTRRDDIDIATHDTYYNPAHPAWTETVCPDGQPEGQSALPGGCVIIHHPGYAAASAYRGNVTRVGRLVDVNATTINADPNSDVTEYNHDIAGNLVSASVSCCNVKTIAYDKLNEYAFPVSETRGSSPTQLTTSATYNRNTGLVLASTDENNQETLYEYETDTLRAKKTIYPNGGYVQTEYSDKLVANTADLLPGFVRQTTTLETNKFAQSYSYFNGRGLGIRSASQTTDGWLISAMEYDALGRVKKSYNPFYGSTPTTAIPTNTKFSEVTAIDALGRTTEVKLQDLTTVSTYFSNFNDIPTGFNKTWVSVTDQAGKMRRQVMDSLGRIVRVDEPDANGSLGAVDGSLPNQQTSYEYDGNDNLTKVTQSDGTTTQERRFKYDALSRLIAEKQVEASPTLDLDGVKGTADPAKWTKVLKYDTQGLLTYGYDARGVRTEFLYDGLNRVKHVNYTGETGDATPNVTYTYDQARSGSFNNGALTTVTTTASGDAPTTSTEFDYDLMGRVRKHRQWIGAQQYDLEYDYNLAGQLTSEKYPSGRIVTNSYDTNGRLSGLSDASRTYVSNVLYQGIGGSMSSMAFGNGTTQTFVMNERFQMTNQTFSKGSEVLQKYDYGYGEINAAGDLVTSKNNGQLGRIESYIGTTKQWAQKFSYDSLGRLKQSEERRGDTNALTYKQVFDFDRFGNMYRKATSNPTAGLEHPLPYTPIEDSDISKATNRLTSNTTYDDAGNVTTDNKFRTMGFGYDANGRMVKATKANTPDALSVYDASGMRVAEKVNDVWRFLIYDIGGKLVAEYGGMSQTDDGGVKYLLSDWQGSTRAAVSNSGYVQGRMDFTAFGEEINAGIGLRTAQQGFGSSINVRQKYGLTERDDATGTDHTWFRKHENRAGRWTSPDPYGGSMSLGNPQSFNRYSYVENQPTNFIDPTGLLLIQYCTRYWVDFGDGGGRHYSSWTCVTIYDDGGGGGHGGAPPGSASDAQKPDKKKKCKQDKDGKKNQAAIEDYLTKAGLLDKSNPDKSLIDPGSINVSGEGITFTIKNLKAFNAALAASPFAFDLDTGFPWSGQHDDQVGGPGVDNRSRTGTKPDKLGPQSLQLVTGPADQRTGRAKGYADLDCSNPAQSFWQAIQHIFGR